MKRKDIKECIVRLSDAKNILCILKISDHDELRTHKRYYYYRVGQAPQKSNQLSNRNKPYVCQSN